MLFAGACLNCENAALDFLARFEALDLRGDVAEDAARILERALLGFRRLAHVVELNAHELMFMSIQLSMGPPLFRVAFFGSLQRVQIFFPDPWHKKKHNKRRLIQPPFVQKLRAKLQVGGVIHLATDWQDYAEQMLAVMTQAEGFANQHDGSPHHGYAPRPDYRPLTKFEARGERLGHGVWDLLFERTAQASVRPSASASNVCE